MRKAPWLSSLALAAAMILPWLAGCATAERRGDDSSVGWALQPTHDETAPTTPNGVATAKAEVVNPEPVQNSVPADPITLVGEQGKYQISARQAEESKAGAEEATTEIPSDSD